MKTPRKLLLGLCVCAGLAAVSPPLRAATVLVFAAASLTESLKEIAADYEKQAGDKIVFNFAGSGSLARQIEAGAPADLFVSADEAQMDGLEKQGLVMKETRRSRLANRLVIVIPTEAPPDLTTARELARPGVKRLAVGDPKTVPVGTYAREYLTRLELWPAVEAKVVPCASARAVLAAVESGNVDAGIVYRTDAAMSAKVKVAFEVSAEDGPRISYPMVLVSDSRQPAAAGRFLQYLGGAAAGEVFARRGFILLPAAPKK